MCDIVTSAAAESISAPSDPMSICRSHFITAPFRFKIAPAPDALLPRERPYSLLAVAFDG